MSREFSELRHNESESASAPARVRALRSAACGPLLLLSGQRESCHSYRDDTIVTIRSANYCVLTDR